MNQILVTEKLYITPELKRKKKIYKINFIISVIVIVILCSFYMHSEYARNKELEISQDLLAGMIQNEIESTDIPENNVEDDKVWNILVASVEQQKLEKQAELERMRAANQDSETKKRTITYTASNGKRYRSLGRIQIPKIEVDLAILDDPKNDEKLVEWLKVSPCKFDGVDPNEVGNCAIAGHNYRNKRFFSKVLDLEFGDEIKITDIDNKTVKYYVYKKYEVEPEDTSCLDENIPGKRIVTLITCTNDSKKRVIVHAQEA